MSDSASPPLYHIAMFSFSGTETAADVLRAVSHDPKFGTCEIEAKAVVVHHPVGRVELHEKGGAAIGATFGLVGAGIVGVVTGPVLVLAFLALGAIAGGIAGHFVARVLPKEDLEEIGESLPPDSSAVLAIVDAEHAECLVDLFRERGARVLDVPVETDLEDAIREGITHHVTRA